MKPTIDEYLTLSPAHRDRVRVAVRDLAVRANERYAGLLAAEAVLAARTTHPDTHIWPSHPLRATRYSRRSVSTASTRCTGPAQPWHW